MFPPPVMKFLRKGFSPGIICVACRPSDPNLGPIIAGDGIPIYGEFGLKS